MFWYCSRIFLNLRKQYQNMRDNFSMFKKTWDFQTCSQYCPSLPCVMKPLSWSNNYIWSHIAFLLRLLLMKSAKGCPLWPCSKLLRVYKKLVTSCLELEVGQGLTSICFHQDFNTLISNFSIFSLILILNSKFSNPK